MDEERILCLFCLREAAIPRVDKKGRPYLTCGWCGARSFLRSFECLNGYRALMPQVAAAITACGGVAEFLSAAQTQAEDTQQRAVGGVK